MSLVFVLLILAVVGAVAAVATGRIAGGLDAPVSSLPARGLPPGDVSVDDLGAVRFAPALRGYRMDQVDAVLDRLADELARRDAELRRLRGRPDLEPLTDPAYPAHPGDHLHPLPDGVPNADRYGVRPDPSEMD